LLVSGHAENEIRADGFALTLVSAEEEGFVFHYRAADSGPKIVVSKRCFSGLGIENIARIQRAVAEEFEDRAMKLIRPGAGNDVDHRAAISSVFRTKLRLQIEFLDGVDGQQRRRGASNSDLVQG
jgi:hypothetical protein